MVRLASQPAYQEMTVRSLRTTLRLAQMMRDRALG
jgi:hypothetical protein